MPKQPTPDEIETTARTLQKLLNSYDGKYDADEALECLFGYMIGTFGKLYDDEEELDCLIRDINNFSDDDHDMFDDLVNAEDIEEQRKKETENTVLVEKIRSLLR